MITTVGKEKFAIRIGSNIDAPGWCAIGSGSGTVTVGDVKLIFETDRNAFSSTDYITSRKFKMTTDFGSLEMSGTKLTEFGIFTTGLSLAGSLCSREGFAIIEFDGTNELRTEITYEVY